MADLEGQPIIHAWSIPPDEIALPPGAVDVWRLQTDKPPPDIPILERFLDPGERERAEKFVFHRDRRQFIIAHAALRSILSLYTRILPGEITYQANAYGKPALATSGQDSGFRFNLSHSGEIVLIAIGSHADVGIDVEKIVPERAEIDVARRFFSPGEFTAYAAIPHSQQTEAFFRCWTRKEAFIKGKGLGLSMDLDLFDVTFGPGEAASLAASRENPTDPLRWRLYDIPAGQGYAAALAVGGECQMLRRWEWQGIDTSDIPPLATRS